MAVRPLLILLRPPEGKRKCGKFPSIPARPRGWGKCGRGPAPPKGAGTTCLSEFFPLGPRQPSPVFHKRPPACGPPKANLSYFCRSLPSPAICPAGKNGPPVEGSRSWNIQGFAGTGPSRIENIRGKIAPKKSPGPARRLAGGFPATAGRGPIIGLPRIHPPKPKMAISKRLRGARRAPLGPVPEENTKKPETFLGGSPPARLFVSGRNNSPFEDGGVAEENQAPPFFFPDKCWGPTMSPRPTGPRRSQKKKKPVRFQKKRQGTPPFSPAHTAAPCGGPPVPAPVESFLLAAKPHPIFCMFPPGPSPCSTLPVLPHHAAVAFFPPLYRCGRANTPQTPRQFPMQSLSRAGRK